MLAISDPPPPAPDHRLPPDKLTAAVLDAAFAEVEHVATERGLDAPAFTDALLSRAVTRLRTDEGREQLRAVAMAAVSQRVDALFGGPGDPMRRAGSTRWVSAHLVDAIWKAIQDGSEHARQDALGLFVARRGADAHVPGFAVDDLLHDLGLGGIASVTEALSSLDVVTETLFPRPARHEKGSMGTTYVRLAEVAALLIRLERFGIAIDPAPLVAAIRPTLARQDLLSGAEIGVWWFERERHRSQPVILAVDSERGYARSESITTAGGYKVEAWLTADDRAVHLWVTAPKYRRDRAK